MTCRAFAMAFAAVALALAGCSESPASGPEADPSQRTTPSSSATSSPVASDDLIADVELEGRRIHLTCFGPVDPAVPTVLLEAGGSSPSDVWDLVMDQLSPTRRT